MADVAARLPGASFTSLTSTDQAEGLRRLMAARPAALARKRLDAAKRPLRVAVLAADEALGRGLAQQLSHAFQSLSGSSMPPVQVASIPVAAGSSLPAAAQSADHLLIALDGSNAHLSSSLTWCYALIKHWHAAGGTANPGLTSRLVLCGVQSQAQAERALTNLSAMTSRHLGCSLAVGGFLRPGEEGAAQDLEQLAGRILQWPLPTAVNSP